jgi:4-amino-4-deoxychorismate lyase
MHGEKRGQSSRMNATDTSFASVVRVHGSTEGRLNPADRGLRYGDSLFETLAYRDGQVEWLDRHLARLYEGAERLQLHLTESDEMRELILSDLTSMLAEAGNPSAAVFRIQVTRGIGGRGYAVSGHEQPVWLHSLHPWPWLDDQGAPIAPARARVRYCTQTLATQPSLAGIKHGNRLEQVLARMEWGSEFEEGLMSDAEGRIIEGTMSNLFVVHQQTLYTPALDRCGIRGVMRGIVIDLAEQLGIPVRISTLNRVFLEQANCLFLTNSLAGIWPVRQLGARALSALEPDQSLCAQLQQRLDQMRHHPEQLT